MRMLENKGFDTCQENIINDKDLNVIILVKCSEVQFGADVNDRSQAVDYTLSNHAEWYSWYALCILYSRLALHATIVPDNLRELK